MIDSAMFWLLSSYCGFSENDSITSRFSQVYPRDIYAFGLIAWTGNDVLNRRYEYDIQIHIRC